MNIDIKNILDKQISQQTITPTISDIVEYSCLFTYSDSGHLEYKAHEKCCLPRVHELLSILKYFNIKNTSFLLYTHDYTKDYNNNTKYVICFGKTVEQSFITVPNNHLLNGTVDHFLNEVRVHDLDLYAKLNQSIFVGGPNGGVLGSRSKYIYSDIDSSKHKIVLTNYPIFNVKDQLKFRFLINIDGHGMCYDRLYWQLASNSVPVYLQRNKNIVQLHDSLLIPNIHYVEYDIEQWKTVNLDNCQQFNDVVNNGKAFVKDHFGISAKDKCSNILKYTIEQISEKQNAN